MCKNKVDTISKDILLTKNKIDVKERTFYAWKIKQSQKEIKMNNQLFIRNQNLTLPAINFDYV